MPNSSPAYISHPSGLHLGWRVVYRDQHQALRDALILEFHERANGTLVRLDSGVTIPIARVLSVARLGTNGKCLSGWSVHHHGIDGDIGDQGHMHTTPDRWLTRYRRIRELTETLSSDDPRMNVILALIDQCDGHYANRDDDAFVAVGKRIASLMAMPPSQQPRTIPPHAAQAV